MPNADKVALLRDAKVVPFFSLESARAHAQQEVPLDELKSLYANAMSRHALTESRVRT